MQHLPIMLNLRDQPVCVVGCGTIAARKADLLCQAGARVTVIGPELKGEMRQVVAEGRVQWLDQPFAPTQLNGARIVIAATDDEAVNEQVFRHCDHFGIPVNVADQPKRCSFILPGIVDRGAVTVAISTGGRSPVLARMLRARIEALVPTSIGRFAELLGEFRQQLKTTVPDIDQRKRFWEALISGPIGAAALRGQLDQARQQIADAITHGALKPTDDPGSSPEAGGAHTRGEVYLIGAGPGDPELLTFKALRLLQLADVVVHDRLVADEIVNLARREARRIYVGKRSDQHTLPQEQINHRLIDLANQGLRVARLKGGDPYIFGRGGEEAQALAAAGVSFTVVPGISAATGCAAAADIPLTHRDHAQSLRMITGHFKGGDDDLLSGQLDWRELAHANQTLVFYMGMKNLREICTNLIDAGAPPTRPAAVVASGTTVHQQVIDGDLSSLADRVAAAGIEPPGLLLIGDVVALRTQLSTTGVSNRTGASQWYLGPTAQ